MSNINISVTEQDPINVSIASPEVQNVDINATTLMATVADGDKGDIVVTGNGTVWTLDPNALATRVPYTGATSDVNLGEFGLLTGNIEFDTTPTNAPTGAGSMVWNDTEGTLDLTLKGASINLPIGQKQVIRAVNGTGGNLTRVQYRAVKIIGAQGQRAQVGLARADNDANSKDTIGIVGEDISNNQEGFIVTSGLIEEINTTGSLQSETWADGDTLYLSGTTSGIITNVKPAAPIHTVILGFVVYAHANHGKIYVKVDNGYELDELHNVNVSTAASGDYLRYNGTTWVDATISAADLPTGIDAAKIATGTVSNTEFGYLDGVTSAIQTQLNAKQATLTLTTTGTSGAATLVGATLNIPQYQAVLTNPVTGTGVSGQVSFFSGTSTVTGDNGLFWDNTNKRLGVGTVSPATTLQVNGTARATRINTTGGVIDFDAQSGNNFIQYASGNVSFANNGNVNAYISSAGNVTIGGTTDAGYKLDIQGTLRNTTSAYFATSSGAVGIGTTTITGGTIFNVAGVSELRGDVYFGKSQATNHTSIYFNATTTGRGEITYDGANNYFKISSTYGGTGTFQPLVLFTGNVERMRILANGDVSIGNTTADPFGRNDDRRVSVDGSPISSTANVALSISSGATAGRGAQIYLGGGSTRHFTISANASESTIGTSSNTPLRISTNDAERMRLTAAGRLLLGTSTESTYLLDVAGDIRNTTSAYFATSSGGVGIGTTTLNANTTFQIASTVVAARIASSGQYRVVEAISTNATFNDSLYYGAITRAKNGAYNAIYIGANAGSDAIFQVTGLANVGISVTGYGTSATNTFAIGSGTAPTTSITDGFQLYSADITAGNAAPHFRTEGGAVIKIYQQTTGVGAATFVQGSTNAVYEDSTFDGYTLKQIVKALRNAGFLA